MKTPTAATRVARTAISETLPARAQAGSRALAAVTHQYCFGLLITGTQGALPKPAHHDVNSAQGGSNQVPQNDTTMQNSLLVHSITAKIIQQRCGVMARMNNLGRMQPSLRRIDQMRITRYLIIGSSLCPLSLKGSKKQSESLSDNCPAQGKTSTAKTLPQPGIEPGTFRVQRKFM